VPGALSPRDQRARSKYPGGSPGQTCAGVAADGVALEPTPALAFAGARVPVFLGELFCDLGALFTRPAFALCAARTFVDERAAFARAAFLFAIRAR
jgi:hypothetical protein